MSTKRTPHLLHRLLANPKVRWFVVGVVFTGLNFPILSDYARAAVRAYEVAHDDFAGLEGYTAAKHVSEGAEPWPDIPNGPTSSTARAGRTPRAGPNSSRIC